MRTMSPRWRSQTTIRACLAAFLHQRAISMMSVDTQAQCFLVEPLLQWMSLCPPRLRTTSLASGSRPIWFLIPQRYQTKENVSIWLELFQPSVILIPYLCLRMQGYSLQGQDSMPQCFPPRYESPILSSSLYKKFTGEFELANDFSPMACISTPYAGARSYTGYYGDEYFPYKGNDNMSSMSHADQFWETMAKLLQK